MLLMKLLAVIGAAGIACSFASLIALHFLPTPVDPIRDPVCNHASFRFGFLFRLQAGATGIAGLCLAALLARSGYAVAYLGMVALIVFSLSRLAIILFPADVKPPRTARGIVHMVLDVLTFVGISLATGFLSYRMPGTTIFGAWPWARIGPELRVAAALTELFATLTAVVLTLPPLRRFVGLNERFLFFSILLWLAAAFAPLLPLL
jgi:hypothetical protein